MTVNDVIHELRMRLNDDTMNEQGEYKNGELIMHVNLALNEFCDRTKCYICEETGTYNNGFLLNEITKPFECVAVSGSDNYVLQRAKPADRYVLYDSLSAGDPRYYTVENKTVKVFPLGTGPYTISVRGYGVRYVNSLGDKLEFLTDGDYPFFMTLCEIYARSTRQHDDDNRYTINHYREQIEQYYRIRGNY